MKILNNPQSALRLSRIQAFFVLVNLIFILGCKSSSLENPTDKITKQVVSAKAGLATAHHLATQIGIDILQQGGNAIDAAIAVQFALAVCYPNAGNIGGGGFMVYRDKSGKVYTLDFREKAPRSSTRDMYLDSKGNPSEVASIYGVTAAGVPGTVDGMVAAFKKFSALKDWKKLVEPAVQIANSGFCLSKREAALLNEKQSLFEQYNRFQTDFQKDLWKEGDLFIQKNLAGTLIRIRDKGRDGFYKGVTAQLIVDEMKHGKGLITAEDLATYHSVWREPIVGQYRDYTVYSMAPPSSGGIALMQLLKMVEPYPLHKMPFHSAQHIHLLAEAEKRVYADRSKYLGDPDFYRVPGKILTDSMYIMGRMKDFNPRQASSTDSITFGTLESEETTHFSIVDVEGNAVSLTTTLNDNFGSFTVVKGAGFLLNNEMDDFSIKAGHPNLYGLIGSEANKVEPGKRMLSSMTPTIVEKAGKLFLVVGTPGGSTIITSVFQVIVNVIDFGKNIYDAVQSPRFHHQWKPDSLYIEEDFVSNNLDILESIGHKIKPRDPIGRVEAILVNPDGTMSIVADRRGDDDAKGY
ncbi:MAG: gamma-glutamyltransferase [Saprospiraceae bacterium]